MTISQSFANFLEQSGIAVLGQNLYIGQAPSSVKTSQKVYWIVATGGIPTRNVTNSSLKEYTVDIFLRGNNREVDEEMSDLETLLNCTECVNLEGFETIDITADILSIDNDLDDQSRKVGLLRATLSTYKACDVS